MIAPCAEREYRIQTGDQLDVKLFYHSELNETVTVRPDGAISLQLVGEAKAAGFTPAELTDALKSAFGKHLRDPEVVVAVKTYAPQRIYVDGEIGKPGIVDYPGEMTLIQALAAAGGMKRSSRSSEVVIIRRDVTKGRQIIVADLRRPAGAGPAGDTKLLPFDVIYVPRTRIANVNNWVDQYIRMNLPVTFGIFASPF